MRIAIVLPRGTYFGPARATAIDLCVRDFVQNSAFKGTTMVFAEDVEFPFDNVSFVGIRRPKGIAQRKFTRLLVGKIADYQPDLIVVHQHLSSAAAISRRFGSIPVMYHRHNTPKKRRNPVKTVIDLWMYSRLAKVLFVSDFSRAKFVAAVPRLDAKAVTVCNGLDVSAWTPAKVPGRTVLFVGRAVPEKGGLEAARAVVAALGGKSEWNACFILSTLAADFPYLEQIRTELTPLGSRADIRLDQPFDVVKAMFENSAVALVPSRFEEPFGRTAIEAMAGGSALVCSLRGGLREVAEGACLEIDPENHRAFTDAVSELVSDEVSRERLARLGRERVQSRFSIQGQSAILDAIYRSTQKQ